MYASECMRPLLFVLPITLWPQIGTGQSIQSLAQRSFSPIVKKYDIPGLVVGITQKGQHTFWVNGFASKEDNTAVSPDTLFEVGSVSKIFNVSLAALAEQRGLLNLNSTVESRIPELKDTLFGKLYLHDLATHTTGGLPLQVPNAVQNIPSLIKWLREWKPTQPGARSYSNISIGLLGYIAANAFSLSYREAVENILFPQMGLKHTWINVPKASLKHYAFGYTPETNSPVRVNLGLLGAEAYGVKTTARDLLHLLDLHMGHAKITKELEGALSKTRQGRSRNVAFVQAMVWERYSWPLNLEQFVEGNSYDFIFSLQPTKPVQPPETNSDNILFSKTGSTSGFGAYVMMLPAEDIGIVVLANRRYSNPSRVEAAYELMQNLLKIQPAAVKLHEADTSSVGVPDK